MVALGLEQGLGLALGLALSLEQDLGLELGLEVGLELVQAERVPCWIASRSGRSTIWIVLI
jgi:hypothetical protein